MSPHPGPPSAHDYLRDLLATGHTMAQIGAALGRSADMISRIWRGKSPGHNLVPALAQMAQTGTVTHPPPRRRRKDGTIVPVRAPGGRTTTPADPTPATPGPSAPHPPGPQTSESPTQPSLPAGRQRGGPRHRQFGGGTGVFEMSVPRSEGPGRQSGRQHLMDLLQDSRLSGRHLSFQMRTASGQSVRLGSKGGYQAAAALARSRNEGDDPLGWLQHQIAALPATTGSPPIPLGDVIVQVSVNYW